MNWNTFDLYTKLPATLQSSGEIARIGSLLQRFGSASYDYRLFIQIARMFDNWCDIDETCHGERKRLRWLAEQDDGRASRFCALLLTAFASGGRRRSEIANLVLSQIREEEPVPADPERPHAARLDCISLLLGRTKTEAAAEDIRVYSIGPPATELRLWIHNAPIKEGPVFRALGRWERLSDSPITPKAINDIIKQRCRLAGLDPLLYSAHGLRAGYLTESARKGVPLIEAMQQSRHKSVQQASRYYNDAERTMGGATRLVS